MRLVITVTVSVPAPKSFSAVREDLNFGSPSFLSPVLHFYAYAGNSTLQSTYQQDCLQSVCPLRRVFRERLLGKLDEQDSYLWSDSRQALSLQAEIRTFFFQWLPKIQRHHRAADEAPLLTVCKIQVWTVWRRTPARPLFCVQIFVITVALLGCVLSSA